MKRTEALEWAEKIAQLILSGSRQVERTSATNQTIMGTLSIMSAMKNKDTEALDPSIVEIILFGSTAKSNDSDEVGDIDLMVFDRGFYSNVLSVEFTKGLTGDSSNAFLRDNLTRLSEGWFGFSRNDLASEICSRCHLLIFMFCRLRFLQIQIGDVRLLRNTTIQGSSKTHFLP